MLHIERFKNSIARKAFDRIPMSISLSQEMADILLRYTGQDYNTLVYKTLDVDRRSVSPRYIGPPSKKYPDGSYENIFGVRMRDVNYGHGQYTEAVGFPLANAGSVGEILRHSWPSAAWYDYNSIKETLDKYPDYPFTVGYHALGWFSWDTRGMSQFLEDLILEPKIADAIIHEVSDFGYEYFIRLFSAGKDYVDKNFTAIHLADDWGTQEGLMISIDLFRRYFKSHYRRIIDIAHAAGVLVEFHCCGSAVELIPEFINIGVDILNPIQTSAKGMTPHLLKEKYGNEIAFSGGVDVQTVLPFSTPLQIRDEVFYLLDTMGKNGGYIIEPSHAIQVGTPPENILAMYKAVYEYYGIGNMTLDSLLANPQV